MGIRDTLARLFSNGSPAVTFEYGNGLSSVLGMSEDELWRTQPYLRTVVTFLARNIAQLGLHFFVRVSDTDRQRLHDDPIVTLFARPNAEQTTYDWVFNLVADWALYDEHFSALYQDPKSPSGWVLQPIPPSWVVRRGGGSAFAVEWIEFQRPNGTAAPIRINTSDMLWFKGWNPGSPRSSSSPVDALKQILAEQMSAAIFREQLWKRGGRLGGVLTRPAGAKWDPKTREKFQSQWQAKYAGNKGAMAGATPILEDGMTYQNVGHSAHEEEYIEASKLALSTVAGVYHVNPTMVGLLDNANFSNVREFRSMLYGDTLGSTISMLEDRINTFVVPRVSNTAKVYGEFNISEKLQGSFEEQASALSTSVGRPWMSADEARARQNLPAMGGEAAQLVIPLNVLVGGQASPRDSAPPKRSQIATKAPRVSFKSDEIDTTNHVAKAAEVFEKFFERQRRVVLTRMGAKSPDWWDAERWDAELTADLNALSVSTANQLGRDQATLMGFDPKDYDEARTFNFLKAVAVSRAGAVNSTTLERLEAALAEDEDPATVFDEAVSARTGSASTALVACLAGFAVVEAGRQLVGTGAEKTWIVTSRNPRPEHAAMNGETVPVDDTFSNGADWPGDPVLGADGVAGCMCGVEITY